MSPSSWLLGRANWPSWSASGQTCELSCPSPFAPSAFGGKRINIACRWRNLPDNHTFVSLALEARKSEVVRPANRLNAKQMSANRLLLARRAHQAKLMCLASQQTERALATWRQMAPLSARARLKAPADGRKCNEF